MSQSADTRWVLSGGDDRTVRLWDTEAFERKLTCSDETRVARAAGRAGAIAADAALGWECVRELMGHTAAVRDVAFNPKFEGPPSSEEREPESRSARQISTARETAVDRAHAVGKKWNGDKDTDGALPKGKPLAKLEHMLASASTDLTLRIWDLSFNPRIPRLVSCAKLSTYFL